MTVSGFHLISQVWCWFCEGALTLLYGFALLHGLTCLCTCVYVLFVLAHGLPLMSVVLTLPILLPDYCFMVENKNMMKLLKGRKVFNVS